MARFRVFDQAPDYQYWGGLPPPVDASMVVAKTSSSFVFSLANTGDYAGWTMTIEGSGFKYANDGSGTQEPVSGRVSSITITDGTSNTVMVIDQFPSGQRPYLEDLYATMFDTGGDWAPWPNTNNFFTLLTNYGDTIIGSDDGDDIFTGRNMGNDTIMAMGGHDYVKGDAGNDTIDGGDGNDTLTYTESFYDYTAYRGIKLNAATGKVTDCWGGTDTISNFEEYHGSRMKDVIIGSDADREVFRGFRGADTINGKGGTRDWVRYDQDEHYGGKRGIVCNLDNGTGKNGDIKGTIRDGFGQIDIILNIERVVGTNHNDKFVGSGESNVFRGLDGRDTFNGRAGFDAVEFVNTAGPVNVNLLLTRGQIIDDGFGYTEKAVNIERLVGTNFDDTLRGDDKDNELEGGDGQDTLRGNGGSDRFYYDQMSAFGDKVLDFISGEDTFAFSSGNIGISTNWQLASDSSGVTTGDSTFYMSGRDLMLDVDGTGGGAAVVVATIQAGGTVAIGDFEVF